MNKPTHLAKHPSDDQQSKRGHHRRNPLRRCCTRVSHLIRRLIPHVPSEPVLHRLISPGGPKVDQHLVCLVRLVASALEVVEERDGLESREAGGGGVTGKLNKPGGLEVQLVVAMLGGRGLERRLILAEGEVGEGTGDVGIACLVVVG